MTKADTLARWEANGDRTVLWQSDNGRWTYATQKCGWSISNILFYHDDQGYASQRAAKYIPKWVKAAIADLA